MRDIPGWVAGAVGMGALVGAFQLGVRSAGTDLALVPAERTTAAEVRHAGDAPRVTGESDAGAAWPVRTPSVSRALRATVADDEPVAVRVSAAAAPVAQPVVIREPVEVYRPRARGSMAGRHGDVSAPARSWERSAVIIGSSAIVAASAGAVVKGRRGAVIGGLLGGGAAAVWDQVTRHRGGDLR